MARLSERIAEYQLVGLDAAVFVYELEEHTDFSSPAHDLFEGLARGRNSACTSVLSLLELTVRPLQYGFSSIAADYISSLTAMPNLRIVEIDQRATLLAANLRARYRLGTIDALHLGACLSAGADVFVTNDRQFRRVRDIPILLLSDFIEPTV